MTCQVRVTSPDGHSSMARGLLDSASSASFITERLAQRLHLPLRHHEMKISNIGGASTKSPQGMVDFKITSLGSEGKTLHVEALVLPKLTSVLPSHPIPFSRKWKHLMNISLVDPDFGTPGVVKVCLISYFCMSQVLYFAGYIYSCTLSYRYV